MRTLIPIICLAVTACSSLSMAQAPDDPPPIDGYAFDEHPRAIAETGRDCPDVSLVKTSGTTIPYNRELEVDENFLPKLQAFEEMVAAEGRAVFGEAPTRLIHRGGYRCRPVTGSKSRWSEHAFGNAIDIAGFQFKKGDDAFVVDVGEHWRASGEYAKHAEFLHRITYRAIHDRLFRIILGPGDPGHEELLHLDFGTSWYVRVELPDGFAPEPADTGETPDESNAKEGETADTPRPKLRRLER